MRCPLQAPTVADPITIRDLATLEEHQDAVRLQEEIWGQGFSERVPAAILMVAQKIGGVTAGAFDATGQLLGFVFGMTGVKHGRLVHWSDLLAVRPSARGQRLGERLKQYQRDRCRALGVETMFWTFDPFVARNAHLNLHLLGASVDSFVIDMYGINTGSVMHGALGTDRFIAAWPIRHDPVPMPGDHMAVRGVIVAAGPPGTGPTADEPLPTADQVLVRIPDDYHLLLDHDLERLRPWRMAARRAFAHYLSDGYTVTDFVADRSGDAAYLLTRTG
jgi:predicted GNAT superfamily acetyltransferase